MVPAFDEIEDRHPRLGMVAERRPVGELALQGREEALGQGVVEAVAAPYTLAERAVGPRPCRRLATSPRVVPARGDAEQSAHRGHRVARFTLANSRTSPVPSRSLERTKSQHILDLPLLVQLLDLAAKARDLVSRRRRQTVPAATLVEVGPPQPVAGRLGGALQRSSEIPGRNRGTVRVRRTRTRLQGL